MDGKSDETAELLFQAIHYKNVDLLRELVDANSGILQNAQTQQGQTPLHYAAAHNATNCISVLCEHELDVDVVSGISDSLKTPLLLATEAGHLDVVKELVHHGADLFYLDANGYSALQLAQLRNHGRIAEYLFERIDELRKESDNLRQELCRACEKGDYAQVLDLLAKSSGNSRIRREVLGPGKQDHEKPALFLAAERGNHDIVGALLTVTEHYAMDSSTGDTVLHAAIRSQQPKCVQLILEAYGKQMNMLNNAKALPLHLACELGNVECVKKLIFHKYPPALLLLFEKNVSGLSYEFACNLNLVDLQCRTALHLAVENGHQEVVELMMKMRLQLYRQLRMDQSLKDADIEPVEMGSPFLLDTYAVDGRTPLMSSVCRGDQRVAEMLLENGADINLPRAITDLEVANLAAEEARCVGSGTLIEAARANDLDLLRMLFFYGASDYDNQALKKAARTDNPLIISTFLDQLTFADQSGRINSNSRDQQLSAMERLKSMDLLGSLRPTTACRLDWHNADLRQLTVEFMVTATLRLNPRVRNHKLALTAITRIDLSDNQLDSIPIEILQLPSLKTLNLDRNRLDELVIGTGSSRSGLEQGCPYLETLSVESNRLTALSEALFDTRLYPQLRFVNIAHNKLRRLPHTLWRSSVLRELNASHNEITDLQAAPSARARDAGRSGGRQSRNPYIAAAEGARRAIDRRQGTGNSSSMQSSNPLGQPSGQALANGGSGQTKRRPSIPVVKMDVLRTNLWQNELNVAPLDEGEDSANLAEPQSPTRKGRDQKGGTDIGNQTNSIRTLNLAGNRFQTLPDCLACYCPRVTKLDLSNNQLTSLRCVECLPANLKHLNLANNKLAGLFKRPDAAALHCYSQWVGQSAMVPTASTSVVRHSRSRSKSVARNQQRSLSIIRASKETENTELCTHKLHCRLEQLKTLNLSHNQLASLELFIPFEAREELTGVASSHNWKDQQLRTHLLFPVLTNLDLSHNALKLLPPNISLLLQLAVLNLNENRQMERLPVELGLLEKLWSVSVNGCALKEPLKSVVGAGNFKTMDLISFLRNELDNSKPYSKLKLMLLGRSEVGKTSLLAQLRQEGTVPKGSLQADSWSARLGHSTKPASKQSGSPAQKSPSKLVDVAEWTFEPPRGSTKSSTSAAMTNQEGPITFRTWDFDRLHKDFQQVPHYFLSRRSICLIVWKVTDGEIALQEIHEWLLAVHARAQNTTVIIVGTHLDCVEENIQRFPDNYLENLERIIQQKFVNVADSEKKGLPKVVALTFVSVKTRYNIQHLCQLIYYAAQQIKTPGRRTKLLQEKVPASFLRLEKIIAQLTDDFRARNEEPIIRLDKLWTRVNNEYILKLQTSSTKQQQALGDSRLFRDKSEFRQACAFLHENGVLQMFEETALRDYCFIDPPWLYTILRTILVHPHMSTTSLASLSVGSGMSIVSTNDLFHQLKTNLAERRIRFSLKHSQLKGCLLALLSRCEMALPCFKRMLLVSPLLPDEYLLRADYPGARIRTKTKVWRFRVRASDTALMASSVDMASSRSSARQHTRLQRQLGYRPTGMTGSLMVQTSMLIGDSGGGEIQESGDEKMEMKVEYKDTYRRLFLMQYVPVGFWPRLTTRILNDEKLCTTISELFVWEENEVEDVSDGGPSPAKSSRLTNDCALFSELNDALNSSIFVDDKLSASGGFEFLLWQSGIECNQHSNYLFSLKQFLPLANVRDTNYSSASLHRRSDDMQWRSMDTEDQFIVELLVPLMELNLKWKGQDHRLRTCPRQATRLLASVVGIIDDLLEDWFPCLGTRFIHSSDGQLLVDRLVPCAECARRQIGDETEWRRKRKPSDPAPRTPVYLFSVEECILGVHQRSQSTQQQTLNQCPLHGECELDALAPDINFHDLAPDLIYESAQIKRGKLLGKGAFGAVFSGVAKSTWTDTYEEVALKVLESLNESQFFGQQNFVATNTSDRLETIARSYCVARQELNLLGDLQHANITVLLGFSRSPLTLLMELAPHGALDQLLSRYRRSELRLSWSTIQHTCAQISRALEYLHLNHVIYRDLKSENVLVWRFPQPHGKSNASNAVHVKLGDYGISRFTYPSDVCKGYGGTEGFMAPEILRVNGEFEYTDKVDCYSFGMFIYELICLRQPYDGQEQMKDCIFEGQRPFLSEKDILCPSNVLDLMVTCWADDASNRPSSSELVTICTAPEFTNLADVALLTANELATVATIVQVETGPLLEHPLQCWLSRPDGLCTVLSFNEFGFVENEQIGSLKSSNITALASVCGKIWSGSADGEITVYCPFTFAELASFHLDALYSNPPTNSGQSTPHRKKSADSWTPPLESKTIRSIFVCGERRAVLITVPNAVLLLSVPLGALLPQHLATMRSDDFIHTAVLVRSAQDWQVWTAHDDARLVMHHLAGSSNRLLYSASAIHGGVAEAKRVKFLVPSRREYGHAWSALENDGRVFMWQNGVVWRTLDCSRILPVSESLSSMFQDDEDIESNANDVDTPKSSRISALSVYSNCNQVEQLLVGTSSGVLIVLECKMLSPLTSFRTYASAVETILCTNFNQPTSPSNEEHAGKGDQQGALTTDGSFFLTIGQKYRNLIKRLAPNVMDTSDSSMDASGDQISYAVVWQGDNWQ